MPDDEAMLAEIAGERGMTIQQYRKVESDRIWHEKQMNMWVQGVGMATGQAGTQEEHAADEIREEYEKRQAKKAEQKSVERWIRVVNQDQGPDFLLKVKVDTGANCNAITHGVLIDHKLESRITRLDVPHEIYLAVGKLILCDKMIIIHWVGKGNNTYGEAEFYVLPQGEANITHRAILAEEWQERTELLFDENEYNSLEPLIVKRESICIHFES